MRGRSLWLGSMASLALAATANAQPADPCAAFESALKTAPTVAALNDLADCREKNNQLSTAMQLSLRAEKESRTATDSPTQALHQVALDRANKLATRVSKILINVPDDSRVDGLEILRNGQPVPAAEWDQLIAIDGGTYTISVGAPGIPAWSITLTIAPERDVGTLTVPRLSGAAGAPRAPTPVAPQAGPPGVMLPAPAATVNTPVVDESPATSQHSKLLVPGIVGAGGVALLATALGFHLSGNAAYDDAKAETMNQARRESLYDSANHKRYAAEALAVGGAACVGVAVWLFVRGRDSDTSQTAVVPSAGTNNVGLTVAGSF